MSYCIDTTWDNICQDGYQAILDSEEPLAGCTDPSFCNYNPLACEDNGVCFGTSGCTYPDACNYDSAAGCDDGSCVFPGCTDPQALNYDILATCPDFDACVYEPLDNECVGDLNDDGFVTSADLSIFLAAFGSDCGFWIPLAE